MQRIAGIFARETRYEFVRAMRTKAFSLSVIGFPVMFYLLFGVMNRGQSIHGQAVAKYMLASYAAFGVVGSALFGIGVGLAGERVSGWLELKRASPMPPLAYLAAKCVASVAFGLIITNILCVIGMAAAGVHLSLGDYLGICTISLAGGIHLRAWGYCWQCFARKLCARHREPDLSAYELLLRSVDANLASSQVDAAFRTLAADVPSGATHAAGHRLRAACRYDETHIRTGWVHLALHRMCLDRLCPRRRGRIDRATGVETSTLNLQETKSWTRS